MTKDRILNASSRVGISNQSERCRDVSYLRDTNVRSSLVPTHKMKAQVLIFEQVMLFVIGVGIFVVCFVVFITYQDYFLSVSVNDQLENVRNLISFNILKLSEKEDEVESFITLPISKNVVGEAYKIELSENGLNVTSLVSGISKFSNLYALNESFNFSGKVVSTVGRIIIYKKEKRIRLI